MAQAGLRGPHPSPDERCFFVCNICGEKNAVLASAIQRENVSCTGCGSTLRWRSVIAALSTSLFGRSLVIDEFPPRVDLVGLGTSDWDGYASRLSPRFSYMNTFIDREPQLDLAVAPAPTITRSCDFVITSDVLEHVPPPHDVSMAHLLQMLKPGGVLVLTVPTRPSGHTVEHFPDLHDYEIVARGDKPVLINHTRWGTTQTFDELVFHGGLVGQGGVLEMRVFSAPDLMSDLERVGFVDVAPFDRSVPEHGILWQEAWSWPVTARAPS